MIGNESVNQNTSQFVKFFVGSEVDIEGTLKKEFPGVEPPHSSVTMGAGGVPVVQLVETGRRMSNIKGPKLYRDCIKVLIVNSVRSRQEIKVTEELKKQFPQQWSEFMGSPEYQSFIKREQDGHGDYHPIEDLTKYPQIGPGLIASLRGAGVTSIESLATCGDEMIDHLPKWKTLKERAQQFVRESKEVTPAGQIEEVEVEAA